MAKVKIILKNGAEFIVECENFTVKKHSLTGELTGYNIGGIVKNRPLFVALNQIVAIVEML